MANCGVIDPEEIDHYIARGGYEGLAKALAMTDEQVIAEVLESGLWGRGGAAFPTGRKWDFLRTAPVTPKYMICNADEGDPGSFVNRNLMESDPHLVIEGMVIGGYATGAAYGYIYIREEYPLPVERMERAIRAGAGAGPAGVERARHPASRSTWRSCGARAATSAARRPGSSRRSRARGGCRRSARPSPPRRACSASRPTSTTWSRTPTRR